MSQISYKESATLTVNGITPTMGAGLTLLASPSLASTATAGDYLAETFIVNPSTPATALNLNKIVTGKTLWMQTDQPLSVTLTQNAVDHVFTVDSFIFMNSAFTAIKLANSSSLTPANINIVILGDRAPVDSNPGIE